MMTEAVGHDAITFLGFHRGRGHRCLTTTATFDTREIVGSLCGGPNWEILLADQCWTGFRPLLT